MLGSDSSESDDSNRPSKRRRTESSNEDALLALDTPPGPPLPTTTPLVFPSISRPRTRAQSRLINTGVHAQRNRLPEGPVVVPEPPAVAASAEQTSSCSFHTKNPRPQQGQFRTEPNAFGLYRIYTTPPLAIPDVSAVNTTILPASSHHPKPRPIRSISEIIAPCPNLSTLYYQHNHWAHSGSIVSRESRNRFQHEVLQRPDFVLGDVRWENLDVLDSQLAASARTRNPLCPESEGWKNIEIQIQIPPVRQTKAVVAKNPTPKPTFISISGLRSQKLTDIMRQGFTTNNPSTFHYTTFEQFWKVPGSTGGRAVRTSGEMYSSPAMIEAHKEVQTLKINDAGCMLPRCVAGFMFASDGLQFGNFANAKGWPIFAYFGNESKYERCKPFTNSCYHAAHIPTLSDEVREQIAKLHGKPPSEALMTHLRRELMHEVWKHLLDEEFIDAWHNGIVIECADGHKRRVFPRILTYSADYPEKVLLATIRNGGKCLCPRCTVDSACVDQMGTLSDMRLRTRKRRIDDERRRGKVRNARQLIYKLGLSVQNKGVEELLQGQSYVPTMNAFSSQLGNTNFNIFAALVVDQLHEIELGVFKTLFRHLVRILHSCDPSGLAVIKFDHRFRNVPTFSSTIRKFSNDVASMSRLAARDFEDILQCCGPVFKGLLPEACDDQAQKLLYLFAQWHGLAKLRLHTEATLKLLKQATTQFGEAIREFAVLTKDLDVRETPKEYARRKKQAEAARTRSKKLKRSAPSTDVETEGRQRCTLNLLTYKFHSMGDYVRCIERFGTCDSYSTQINELHNRSVKLQYLLTNKRNPTAQMTDICDIKRVLSDMMDELEDRDERLNSLDSVHTELESDAISSLISGMGYSIGQNERSEDKISSVIRWVRQHEDDDATKFFIPQLKRHALLRLLGSRDHPDYHDRELDNIYIHKDRMYSHKTLRLNYTAYDVVRQQDVLNPNTAMRFIMLPTERQNPTDHPFLYAKILGIYHAKFVYKGAPPCRMDFIHVRWLYYDYSQLGGSATCRLDRLTYETCRTNQDVLDSFDFVDPADVIRASHLIPDFDSEVSSDLLNGPSVALDDIWDGDWNYYYVNRFVDRDMLMRYLGGGVGHCWRNEEEPANALDGTDETGALNNSEEAGEAADEPEEINDPEIEDRYEVYVTDEAEDEAEEEGYGSEGDFDEGEASENDIDDGENGVDEEWDDLYGF
ncbi:hypothetical protein FRC08_002657 [Ceratobasidium sp. 394]|nr:hypothetical protein FRC08_002657 [Ceratobasidium sp. 394]